MKTGFGAVNQGIKEAKERVGQGASGRLNYFTWKENETKVLRFLSDEVLLVEFYEMVIDNQGSFKDFIVAPNLYEDDPTWKGEDWVLKYGGRCYEKGMSGERITPKSKPRSVGVAVLLEEAPAQAGSKALVYQDHLFERSVDGEVFPARFFGVVKQSLGLFWTQMSGYHQEFGTICDRPYKIKRVGARLDTQYTIIPLKADDPFDIKALQENYGYGRKVDPEAIKSDPERFLYCPETIEQWAEDYASESRAKHWLSDPRAAAAASHANGNASDGAGEFHEDTTHNPSPETAAPAPATNFSELRARLEKHT